MRKIQDSTPLLTNEEVDGLLFNLELHDKNSFFVIDKERKAYDTDMHFETHMDRIKYLREKYETGHTIVIKNMEHFNASIREAAEELGRGTDVHLYLAPSNGNSFDWHCDDKTVWIRVERGTKMFGIRTKANETITEDYIKLETGRVIYIPKGQYHKATVIGSSIVLSFGLPNPEDL